jgi:hypothetical protein
MWTDLAVRGSIAAATLSWAAAEWLRWRHPARMANARAAWTAGAVLLLGHALAVFHYVHHWSQDAALEHTARQTAALTGLHWGAGLYVNYAFLALWLLDAAAWWANPDAYARRSNRRRACLLAIFLFMFVNAGIVFAHGPARLVGLFAVGTVVWATRNPGQQILTAEAKVRSGGRGE